MGENSDGDASSTLSTETSDAEESGADGEDGSGGSDEPEETEYELSSDYEILPEGTTEEDIATEEEYDYAADDEYGAESSEATADSDDESVDERDADAGLSKVERDEPTPDESAVAEGEGDSQAATYESPDVSLDPAELDLEEAGEPSVGDEFGAGDGPAAGEEGVHDPIQDEEMPLADHIEEMVRRLAIVIAVAGTVSLAAFFAPTGNGTVAEWAINFLWDSVLPADTTTRPTVYGPLSLIMTEFKVASLAGVIIAMPVLVYESYQFMKPGLYPHERRYYLAAVPTSLVLAVVGVAFAYTPILPLLFQYFFKYTRDITEPAFGLTKTFNLILAMMGYFAVIFQIPLFIMLAIMMGVTTRDWLASRRLYFWGGFLGIAFFFVAVDPTGIAPIIIAGTMIALFEGTLFLLKWTGR